MVLVANATNACVLSNNDPHYNIALCNTSNQTVTECQLLTTNAAREGLKAQHQPTVTVSMPKCHSQLNRVGEVRANRSTAWSSTDADANINHILCGTQRAA